MDDFNAAIPLAYTKFSLGGAHNKSGERIVKYELASFIHMDSHID